MKKTNRVITLILALFLMLGVTVASLVSCGDEENVCETCVDADSNGKCDVCGNDVKKACTTCVDTDKNGKCDVCGNTVENTPSEKTDYTVTVKTVGGMALEGVVITVFEDDTLENLEAYATTDAT